VDRPLSHDAIAELLGAYALDAVDVDEAAAVEAHLADCPRCRDDLANYRQTAAVLAGPGGEAPPGLWDGIAARITPPADQTSPGSPPGLRPMGGSAPAQAGLASSRVVRVVAAVVAVAAAVAITVLGVEVAHLNHRVNQVAAGTTAQNVSEAARHALLDPQSRRIVLTGPGPGTPVLAEVVIDGSGTAFLFNRGLPALPLARTYQLWLTGGTRPVSVGLLGAQPGTVALAIGPVPLHNAFAISVEPARGSVAPSLPVVASAA
jgi:hypothetical protein